VSLTQWKPGQEGIPKKHGNPTCLCALNNRAPKCVKLNSHNGKEKYAQPILLGDANSIFIAIDKISRQKSRKVIVKLNIN
jgi:hypothetical protein